MFWKYLLILLIEIALIFGILIVAATVDSAALFMFTGVVIVSFPIFIILSLLISILLSIFAKHWHKHSFLRLLLQKIAIDFGISLSLALLFMLADMVVFEITNMVLNRDP